MSVEQLTSADVAQRSRLAWVWWPEICWIRQAGAPWRAAVQKPARSEWPENTSGASPAAAARLFDDHRHRVASQARSARTGQTGSRAGGMPIVRTAPSGSVFDRRTVSTKP